MWLRYINVLEKYGHKYIVLSEDFNKKIGEVNNPFYDILYGQSKEIAMTSIDKIWRKKKSFEAPALQNQNIDMKQLFWPQNCSKQSK